jgi:hypothetical protein
MIEKKLIDREISDYVKSLLGKFPVGIFCLSRMSPKVMRVSSRSKLEFD